MRRLAPAIALLLPALAQAGTVVLHAPDLDAVATATTAKEALGTGAFRIAGPVTDYVGPADGLVVLGAPSRRCDGADGASLADVLKEATRLLLEMEDGRATEVLRAATSRLPCGAADATRASLYSLFFLTGIAEFNAGAKAEATTAFAHAAAISPGQPWDSAYAPPPMQTYLAALQQVVSAPTTSLSVEVPAASFDTVAVDAAAPAPLRRGGHLLTSGGQRLWVEVGADPVLVTDGAHVVAGLTAGDARYTPVLAQIAAAQGWTDVVVVSAGGVLQLRDGALLPVEAAARARVAGPPPTLGIVVGGGALAAAGFAMFGAAWTEGESIYGQSGQEVRYDTLYDVNRAGLGLGVAGAAITVVGTVLTAAGAGRGDAVTALPFVVPGPGGIGFGVGGRWR